ncbi:protein tyrosine phosphatase domain-containing protein 1-like isoform X2 [Photinus pyralis]|nr:protein tyrosine phosphatase domain-containing protein 1-like isoform X2 [Photinus pyralis]
MARPSTAVIIKKNIIEQFQSLGIKSIINLQSAKEHASCGEPLEDSGFSYDPNIFMENDIYYYNFAWKDYGDASLSELLNPIKVLAFAVTEGRVAIHCHAGLGRTGVLIACYLVYSLRVSANDSIKFVRLKRPGSVQTRGQINCVRHFAQFILPQNITYYLKYSKGKYMVPYTLKKFLRRQRIVLHGYDERNFKYIPKIVHVICERMLELCGCQTDEFSSNALSITQNFLCIKVHGGTQQQESFSRVSSVDDILSTDDLPKLPTCNSSYTCNATSPSPSPSECDENTDASVKFSDSYSDLSTLDGEELKEDVKDLLLNENKCFQELVTNKQKEDTDSLREIYDRSEVISSLLIPFDNADSKFAQTILEYENTINASQFGWKLLKNETNIAMLASLLYDWLETLRSPVLGTDDLEVIVINYKLTEQCLAKFDLEEACLIEYLINFIAKLGPMSDKDEENVLLRMLAALTQQTVVIENETLPMGRDFRRFREGTLTCARHFFKALLPLTTEHHQKFAKARIGGTSAHSSAESDNQNM